MILDITGDDGEVLVDDWLGDTPLVEEVGELGRGASQGVDVRGGGALGVMEGAGEAGEGAAASGAEEGDELGACGRHSDGATPGIVLRWMCISEDAADLESALLGIAAIKSSPVLLCSMDQTEVELYDGRNALLKYPHMVNGPRVIPSSEPVFGERRIHDRRVAGRGGQKAEQRISV